MCLLVETVSQVSDVAYGPLFSMDLICWLIQTAVNLIWQSDSTAKGTKIIHCQIYTTFTVNTCMIHIWYLSIQNHMIAYTFDTTMIIILIHIGKATHMRIRCVKIAYVSSGVLTRNWEYSVQGSIDPCVLFLLLPLTNSKHGEVFFLRFLNKITNISRQI